MGSINTFPAPVHPLASASTAPLPNPTPAAQSIFSLLPSSVALPPATPPQHPPPRFLVIGAGSRGNAYARSITRSTRGVIAAVAEPHPFQRAELGRKYIWGRQGRDTPVKGEAFASWQEWLDYEVQWRKKQSVGEVEEKGVDGVLICVLDEMHAEIIMAIAEAGLKVHVLCEKPLATSWEDCIGIWKAMKDCGRVFGIGHVLRYSPHNLLLRKLLLEDNVIGDILSIEHTEPVGWWHYSHSYVRGNWRRETPGGVGSLLTKSCHDIDFIMWLLCSPPPTPQPMTKQPPPHLPKFITSTGHLSYFRPSRKPVAAGDATNCLSCPAEPTCIYSAKKIYIDRHIHKERDTGWPLKIVAPEIEDVFSTEGWDGAENLVLSKLGEDYTSCTPDSEVRNRGWYGRCVYASDNNVCDDQVVTMTWNDESLPSNSTPSTTNEADARPLLPHRAAKTALFHMVAQKHRQCERYGNISGTLGHLSYDGSTITAHNFVTDETTRWTPPRANPKEHGHGGGDDGLARQFVSAVEVVETGEMISEEANRLFLGVSLEECVRSHAVVFAAEESRHKGGFPVQWEEWEGRNWKETV